MLGGYLGDNDSGTGAAARLPGELSGLNGGAFVNPLFWSGAHNCYFGLLCFVPWVGLIVPFVLLVKGNEWAWQHRRFESIEHFRAVQSAWAKWGWVCAVIYVAIAVFVWRGIQDGPMIRSTVN